MTSFFKGLFGKSKDPSRPSSKLYVIAGKELDEIISLFRTGLALRLYNAYLQDYGAEAPMLCGAILNYAFNDIATNTAAAEYGNKHRDFVIQEAKKLHTDEETAKALSHYFSAQIAYLHLSAQSGNTIAENALPDFWVRAVELSIEVLTFEQVCGSDDMDAYIQAMKTCALQFRAANRAVAPRPAS